MREKLKEEKKGIGKVVLVGEEAGVSEQTLLIKSTGDGELYRLPKRSARLFFSAL